MSKKIWRELLEYGRWAPSPHNTQPWLFKFDDNNPESITLLYDPKRLIPGTNPTGSFMQVGFGILNETLSIAAAPLGFDIEVQYKVDQLDANKIGPQPLARLTLIPRKKEEKLNRQLILDRRTSRLPYNGQPIQLELLQELAAIAKEYNHLFEFSNDKAEVNWVVRLNANTMFADMREVVARNEVGSWMRFSRESAEKKADGLAAYAMQIPGVVMWLFVHANWIFNIPGVYQLVRWIYERTMQGTATVAWISGPFDKPTDWEKAGHMMARIWLTMTKYGVYLHPFGSVITNHEAHKEMDAHFKNDSREHDLWMLVRLGYGDTPPQAQRLPLEQMIIEEKPEMNQQAHQRSFFHTKHPDSSEQQQEVFNYSCS
ncbi:hypothetical protein Lgra_1430 [Legionella gratiana]|uniref:Nitroreductase family n=1 Tax=Legionella gratiana TaxID=45066 RepID=A0A378JEU7_9GAMM|nr:hypothetical protein [Legionella gratiana]KTD11972.1 hypothetical protein Lgra_1430 [Legionella gratiana]STX46424.1 Nitroreductase family [Legionella gratiana]